MRKALGTLPWVEQGTIQIDVKTREARLNLTEKGQCNEEAIIQALKAQGFLNAQVKARPS